MTNSCASPGWSSAPKQSVCATCCPCHALPWRPALSTSSRVPVLCWLEEPSETPGASRSQGSPQLLRFGLLLPAWRWSLLPLALWAGSLVGGSGLGRLQSPHPQNCYLKSQASTAPPPPRGTVTGFTCPQPQGIRTQSWKLLELPGQDFVCWDRKDHTS